MNQMNSSTSNPSHTPRKNIVIFGAGGFARLAYIYLSKDSTYNISGFTVHRNFLKEDKLLGLDVIPFEDIESACPPDQFGMFIAIGYEKANVARANVYESCKRKGYELISYVSSKAVHWGEFEIGDNSFIYEGTVIHPFVKIGNDVVIGSGNHIGHDTLIGDHCFIAGHVMIPGFVTIGDYCFIGANSTLKDGITIAPHCIIGAGAIILKDTKRGEVYIAESTETSTVNSSVMGEFMHSPYFRKKPEVE